LKSARNGGKDHGSLFKPPTADTGPLARG
jgi:hypothetical protein